jgi:hypothetical protein
MVGWPTSFQSVPLSRNGQPSKGPSNAFEPPAIVRPISLDLVHSQLAPETCCGHEEGRRSVSFPRGVPALWTEMAAKEFSESL